jgi:hypothetical protein
MESPEEQTESTSQGPFVQLEQGPRTVRVFDVKRFCETFVVGLVVILAIAVITVPSYWIGKAILGYSDEPVAKFAAWITGVGIMCAGICGTIIGFLFLVFIYDCCRNQYNYIFPVQEVNPTANV